MQNTTHLLYLHGFRSSPQSLKARQMAALVAARHPAVTWWCPQLPPSPREAMAMVMLGIADWPRDAMAVVGSSLGGFYATHVAEHTGCQAMLLNPVRDLEKHIRKKTSGNNPQEGSFFQPEFVQVLRDLTVTCSKIARLRHQPLWHASHHCHQADPDRYTAHRPPHPTRLSLHSP